MFKRFMSIVFMIGVMLVGGSVVASAASAPADGTVVRQTNYEFKYNYRWAYSSGGDGGSWAENSSQNGWGVKYIGAKNITVAPPLPDIVSGYPVVDMNHLFRGVWYFDITQLDPNFKATYITHAESAFEGCHIAFLPSDMVLDSLTHGDSMFEAGYHNGSARLTELPRGMKLNALISGRSMFSDTRLKSLPANMTLNSLEDGAGMFKFCDLTSLPASMTLSALTDGYDMFSSNELTSLPTEMTLNALLNGRGMFSNNELVSLPPNMTLNALSSGYIMFGNNKLTTLPLDMTLNSLTTGNMMFAGNKLTELPTNMTLSELKTGESMFDGNNLKTLPTGMILPKLSYCVGMFRDNHKDADTIMDLPDALNLITSNRELFTGSRVRFTRNNAYMTNYAKSRPSEAQLWSVEPIICSVTDSAASASKVATLLVTADFSPANPHPDSSYSFDGGTTWQATNTKDFTTNQTVNIAVREAGGLITTETVVITKLKTQVAVASFPDGDRGITDWTRQDVPITLELKDVA